MEHVSPGLIFGVLIPTIIIGIIAGKKAGTNSTRQNLPGVSGATCIGCMLIVVIGAILGIFGVIITASKPIDMGQLVGYALGTFGLSMLLGWLGNL